jgi:hypothetical protein
MRLAGSEGIRRWFHADATRQNTRRHRRLYAWVGVALVIAPWFLIWALWRAWPWF